VSCGIDVLMEKVQIDRTTVKGKKKRQKQIGNVSKKKGEKGLPQNHNLEHWGCHMYEGRGQGNKKKKTNVEATVS